VVSVLEVAGLRKPHRGAIALSDVPFALEVGAGIAACGERPGESTNVSIRTRIRRRGADDLRRGGRGVERRSAVDTRASGLAAIELGSRPAPRLTAVENVFPAESRPAGAPPSTFARSG
jgi:ABC-type sugar transport system ATPase subunit